ncbi:MAG: amidohydrolase family protein [Acidobacteria bacterium]|nr:amidohydrolase family protein [Acidobacteriota bacterium]
MKRNLLRIALAAGTAAVLTLPGAADAPRTYAVVGGRIVTAAGPVIENGTVVLRNGIVEAVGASVSVPPDAATIDGKGLSVYPGLIDMGTSVGLSAPATEAPRNARTRMEVERVRRRMLLRAHLDAASLLKADAPEFDRFAAAGITSVLLTPTGSGIRGRSALVNVAAGDDPPQIGQVANERAGMFVVKAPVALHLSYFGREGFDAYPTSLMGAIAFVRQAFHDAAAYREETARQGKPGAGPPPAYDPALEALQPALAGSMPVAIEAASAVQIRRALALAREFKLSPIVVGALGASEVVPDLKAAGAAVIYSLDYPVRPRSLAPGADEPVRVLRERANAPKVPAALDRAGVRFAFASSGLREPADFVKNASKAVAAGLPADAAVRALTIEAARIAGVAESLGSIEKGKRANLIVTEGDLFGAEAKVRHVFVDGRPLALRRSAGVPAAQ